MEMIAGFVKLYKCRILNLRARFGLYTPPLLPASTIMIKAFGEKRARDKAKKVALVTVNNSYKNCTLIPIDLAPACGLSS